MCKTQRRWRRIERARKRYQVTNPDQLGSGELLNLHWYPINSEKSQVKEDVMTSVKPINPISILTLISKP